MKDKGSKEGKMFKGGMKAYTGNQKGKAGQFSAKKPSKKATKK